MTGTQLVLNLDEAGPSVKVLIDAVQSVLKRARAQSNQAQSMNNLKQIGLAMHNFHDAKKRFPASGTKDENGRPLLSWRVHILPYLGEKALFDQFHLNEPWNSEHNRKLVSQMPAVFAAPGSQRNKNEGWTVYREITGDHFAASCSRSLRSNDSSRPKQ